MIHENKLKFFQNADLSVKVPICLKSGANLSQCRHVLVPICPSADMSSIPKNTTFRCSEHIFDSTQVPVIEVNNISSQRVVHENSGIRVISPPLPVCPGSFRPGK